MNGRPDEMLMQAWKQQLDCGLRALEALIEGATRLREIQMTAATEAHADTVAAHKAMAAANNGGDLFRLQAEWTRRNAEKSLRYWRNVSECTIQCGAEVATCISGGNSLSAVPVTAYKQWLEASERFYRMPAAAAAESIPATPVPPNAAPGAATPKKRSTIGA